MVNYGSYRLLNTGENTWEVQMTLKTSALHNKIIGLHPELKGMSLHSDIYKNEIYKYLNSCVLLENNNKHFQLLAKEIKISSHQTLVVMQVIDMADSLTEISIGITCYTEDDSHTKNELTIQKGIVLKTISLDERNTEATFNFIDKDFVVNATKSKKTSAYIFLLSGLVLIIGIVIFKRIISKK